MSYSQDPLKISLDQVDIIIDKILEDEVIPDQLDIYIYFDPSIELNEDEKLKIFNKYQPDNKFNCNSGPLNFLRVYIKSVDCTATAIKFNVKLVFLLDKRVGDGSIEYLFDLSNPNRLLDWNGSIFSFDKD